MTEKTLKILKYQRKQKNGGNGELNRYLFVSIVCSHGLIINKIRQIMYATVLPE